MRYLSVFGTMVVMVFLLAFSTAFAADKEGMMSGETMGKEATVTGQVIDPACYIGMGLKGESHIQCATACGKAGQTFGILDEKNGVLYQVIAGAPTTDPNKLLWDHIEKNVTVKGKVFEKDGMHAIVPEEVKPAGN